MIGNPRYFNSISIDFDNNLVTKTVNSDSNSSHVQSLRDEIVYLCNLPIEIASYFPRVIDFSDDLRSPFVKMEYIDGITAATAFLDSRVPIDTFGAICVEIKKVIELFKNINTLNCSVGQLAYMFETKTLDRLAEAKAFWTQVDTEHTATMIKMYDQPFTVGRGYVDPLPEIARKAWRYVSSCEETFENFSVIHGDLIFSNIIYQTKEGKIKLVDPRGSFGGVKSLAGSPVYDKAKLAQSYIALYEIIEGGDYAIVDPLGIQLRYDRIIGVKQELAQKILGKNTSNIRMMVVLLLLSLLPLHRDSQINQLAYILRAIQLFKTRGELSI